MADEVRIKTTVGQNSHFKDPNKNEPAVDLEDEKCVLKWANVLHITVDELKKAVKEFGPKIRKIRLGLAAREKHQKDKAA